jgi:hypothetical protein
MPACWGYQPNQEIAVLHCYAVRDLRRIQWSNFSQVNCRELKESNSTTDQASV